MIWQTECLARIDPADGTVLGWIDMEGITKHTRKQTTAKAELRGAPPAHSLPPVFRLPSPLTHTVQEWTCSMASHTHRPRRVVLAVCWCCTSPRRSCGHSGSARQ
jgi:hypothetical protein